MNVLIVLINGGLFVEYNDERPWNGDCNINSVAFNNTKQNKRTKQHKMVHHRKAKYDFKRINKFNIERIFSLSKFNVTVLWYIVCKV